jgi:hypothetical protein
MIPTIQTKIKREAEKKYMTNSMGFFKLYEPNKVLTPIIKKSKDRSKTATFLTQIRTFMQDDLFCPLIIFKLRL